MKPDLALSIVRSYLSARYTDELAQTLRDEKPTNDDDPVWRLVNAEDLRSSAEPSTINLAGILLDSELGLVFFVIPYGQSTNIQEQAIVASALQSSLHPLSPPVLPSDEHGSWQVAIHWLVEESARAAWETQIVQLRQRTGFSEELVLDAVFYSGEELESNLVEHGLPRLLFTTRHVLSQRDQSEAAKWMSADHAVLRELENFRDQFSVPEQKQRASLVQDHLHEVVLATKAGENKVSDLAAEVNSLEVCDFRNLGHVRLHFGLSPVSCRVIHGPNGTGKTSLFEALSLALSHSSIRYKTFLRRDERDLISNDRRTLYLEKYLTPFASGNKSPRIGVNGIEPVFPQLPNSWEDANRLDLEFSGNLLAQETSQEFLQMSSDELALRVLSGYSELAERLEAFVEEQVEKATQRRQLFLRSLRLTANITRVDTALARIAEQIIHQHLQAPPASLLTWLDAISEIPPFAAEFGGLNSDWRQLSEGPVQLKLAEKLAVTEEAEALSTLENWIADRNRLILRFKELRESIDERLHPIHEHLSDTIRDLTAWGEWLEHRSNRSPQSSNESDVQLLRHQLAEVQTAQEKAISDGRANRQHLDHLEQVTKSISQGLTSKEPNKCPTCGADHSADGGTRYLTYGRFRSHVLALDDPAQQLDQTSYCELCRLWRVLIRLHTIRKLPLRLILFLHQEDRALDAARATQGLVGLLSWSQEQEGVPRELELFAPNAAPSRPEAWFQRQQAVA